VKIGHRLNFFLSLQIAQYYNFVRLGRQGYTSIIENDIHNARLLSHALENCSYFDLVSDMHRAKGVFGYERASGLDAIKESVKGIAEHNESLPVVAFKLTDDFKRENPHVKQAAVSTLLRTRGWIIPNYPLPPSEEHIEILRIVVRESFSQDLVDNVLSDIIWAVETLAASENGFDAEVFAQKADPIQHAHKLEHPAKESRKKKYGSQC
jgi:glutamate decarboxylase